MDPSNNIQYHPPATPAPSHTPLENPIMVIDPHFVTAYPVDLIMTEKVMSIRDGSFKVLDINGTLIFQVKGSIFSIRDRRVLLDVAENPIISLQQKILTAHRRWQVFRGDSSDAKDLLFSVKKSSLLQFKTHLHVFLASNTTEDACDFTIKGSWSARSCVICLGDSDNIIAQMHENYNVKSELLGQDSFSVTVYPHVDYAFIVALVLVLHEIDSDRAGED